MINDAVIYDFETLSQAPEEAAVVSCAMLSFNMEALQNNGYTYESLLEQTHYIKFNIDDQVKNWNRKIDRSTLEWWQKQSKEALAMLKPSSDDVSISELHPWFVSKTNTKAIKYAFTRNNSFDPVIFSTICRATNNTVPYPWWGIRDTKSFIWGLTYEMGIRDDFIPPDCENKYVKHDPRHDIVFDVMRMQTILTAKFGD
jgi:hypothetical protein